MDLKYLNQVNREASLGRGYNLLNSIYPGWSKELHSWGNSFDNSKLEIISINGLI